MNNVLVRSKFQVLADRRHTIAIKTTFTGKESFTYSEMADLKPGENTSDKTFRVISIVNGTQMVISPAIVSAQGGSDAELQYQNVVVTAPNAAAAITWLKENPMPDLEFMDIQLADGRSFEIFAEVLLTAPVIFNYRI